MIIVLDKLYKKSIISLVAYINEYRKEDYGKIYHYNKNVIYIYNTLILTPKQKFAEIFRSKIETFSKKITIENSKKDKLCSTIFSFSQ